MSPENYFVSHIPVTSIAIESKEQVKIAELFEEPSRNCAQDLVPTSILNSIEKVLNY